MNPLQTIDARIELENDRLARTSLDCRREREQIKRKIRGLVKWKARLEKQ